MKNEPKGNVMGTGKCDCSGDVESMPSAGTQEVKRPKQPMNCADVSEDMYVSRPGER